MPIINNQATQQSMHSDDMQDIITTVPSWLLRWGISLFFGILLLIIGLSAFIKYPDIVTASLKVISPNSPKAVVSKISGKLVKIMVVQNEGVKAGQPLAYIESTGNHTKVLNLLTSLQNVQHQVLTDKPVAKSLFNPADNVQLGELQSAYQTFYAEYLNYISSINDGFLLKKRNYLRNDLVNITRQQQQLQTQKTIQQRDLVLAGQEFDMHRKLKDQKVETSAEFRQEESKFLAKKAPLSQTQASIIAGRDNYTAKQKDIMELDNEIQQEMGKFLQALNSLISAAEDWRAKYVLVAQQSGKVTYAGIVQENQDLSIGQEVFYINPGNEKFFGEMIIPQNNLGKVKEGQQVLIKLKSYPFEEYGIIKGQISYISDVLYKDSIFMAKVDFKLKNSPNTRKPINLKSGMAAEADIVTQDATILQRITRSLLKMEN